MADMSQDDLDSIFGGEEGAEPPPAEVSSEESAENLFGGGEGDGGAAPMRHYDARADGAAQAGSRARGIDGNRRQEAQGHRVQVC